MTFRTLQVARIRLPLLSRTPKGLIKCYMLPNTPGNQSLHHKLLPAYYPRTLLNVHLNRYCFDYVMQFCNYLDKDSKYNIWVKVNELLKSYVLHPELYDNGIDMITIDNGNSTGKVVSNVFTKVNQKRWFYCGDGYGYGAGLTTGHSELYAGLQPSRFDLFFCLGEDPRLGLLGNVINVYSIQCLEVSLEDLANLRADNEPTKAILDAVDAIAETPLLEGALDSLLITYGFNESLAAYLKGHGASLKTYRESGQKLD